jgi:hypothetical protein
MEGLFVLVHGRHGAPMEGSQKPKTRGIEGRENRRRGTKSFGTQARGSCPSSRTASILGWRGELEFLLPIVSRHRRERRAHRASLGSPAAIEERMASALGEDAEQAGAPVVAREAAGWLQLIYPELAASPSHC